MPRRGARKSCEKRAQGDDHVGLGREVMIEGALSDAPARATMSSIVVASMPFAMNRAAAADIRSSTLTSAG